MFITQSRVLGADWLILENIEKATLHINMPYCTPFPAYTPSSQNASLSNFLSDDSIETLSRVFLGILVQNCIVTKSPKFRVFRLNEIRVMTVLPLITSYP